jgi:hypothetical protein
LEEPFDFTGFVLVLFEEVVGDRDAGLEWVLEVLEYGGVGGGVLGFEQVFVVLEDVGVHF